MEISIKDLRDDIWCSVEGCQKCKQEKIHLSCNPRKTKLSEYPQLIIPDTNIFLHQVIVILLYNIYFFIF